MSVCQQIEELVSSIQENTPYSTRKSIEKKIEHVLEAERLCVSLKEAGVQEAAIEAIRRHREQLFNRAKPHQPDYYRTGLPRDDGSPDVWRINDHNIEATDIDLKGREYAVLHFATPIRPKTAPQS
jgi:hypothetical protein